MAETVAIFTTALALYWAYRYWHEPTWPKLAIVGIAAGAGALSRSELVLIVPLMVVPLAVLVPGPSRADRWRGIGAGAVSALLVMAPWLVFNMKHRSALNGTPLDARFTNLALEARAAGYDPVLFGYTDALRAVLDADAPTG